MNAGRRAEETYNFPEAAKMYEEAIVCLGKITPQPSVRSRLLPTLRLGSCLRELARYNESETVLTQCLSEAEAELAEGRGDEQMYVHALTALATLRQYQSKYNEARELYERALPIARRVEDSSASLWLAGHIAGYAEILRKSGDLPSAEKLHREALEMRKERSCTELEMAVSYTQLGCTLFGLKRYQEAYKQHRLALLSRFKYLDFSHGLVSESLNYCAEALCALGRSEDGIPLAMHGVEIRKQVFGPSHPALAHAFSILASNYHAVGRSCDAKQLLEKCLAICEEAFPKNHANIIPNLMNYGKVLRSLGNYRKAREVYERSIVIHQLNFKTNQKADQLEKCRSEVKELAQLEAMSGEDTPDIARGVMPIPPVNMELGSTPIIVLTDVGRDVDDEYALILLGALTRMNLLTPLAIVTTLSPARQRANLTRGSLDALGLAKVPVGVGGSGGLDGNTPLEVYEAQYSRSCSCIFESGINLMVRALESAPDNTVQLLCIASLQDAATLIRGHDKLFRAKVKEVLIMGGAKIPFNTSEFLEPDTAYNNNCDMVSARFVYRYCQEAGIPTLTLTRYTAYGCPVSNVVFDDLVKTAHMVGINTRRVSYEGINRLWHKVNLAAADPRREKLPSRCDRQWFCRTFFGKEDVNRAGDSGTSIWDLVTKLNMYDPLTMLCCIPEYRETYFYWESFFVNGIQHRVTGISETNNGVIDSALLCKKLYSLFGLSLRNALQNIC
uniref:Inosine/uridine-preferring nucleoside hydrolase domain-containing protein n=1 Tax=Odontella aurita TaxID=265563 RepID=A0A7S4NFP3_9STRA|mmetsp:Transcript_62237/g.184067  ORF Transcript_62237/g.184067 Transcript_62237/m.184067 type:complete len:730 (+) Transcript_62237:133-2322(+)